MKVTLHFSRENTTYSTNGVWVAECPLATKNKTKSKIWFKIQKYTDGKWIYGGDHFIM